MVGSRNTLILRSADSRESHCDLRNHRLVHLAAAQGQVNDRFRMLTS